MNNKPINLIDPTSMGGITRVVYYNDRGGPVKVVISSTIYFYTDDPSIDMLDAATQIKNDLESTLNRVC